MDRYAILAAAVGALISTSPAVADDGEKYVCFTNTGTGQYMCRAWGPGGGQVMAYDDGIWVLLYTWTN